MAVVNIGGINRTSVQTIVESAVVYLYRTLYGCRMVIRFACRIQINHTPCSVGSSVESAVPDFKILQLQMRLRGFDSTRCVFLRRFFHAEDTI